MSDSILYIALKFVVFSMRFLPLNAWLFFARLSGRLYYYLSPKQNRKAYSNLKQAFGASSRFEIKKIMRVMYVNFAQNLIEAMYLKWMSPEFIKKNVSIRGIEVIEEAKKSGRGIIFLASHAGSWELSNAITASLFPGKYAMLAQPQSHHKKLDAYLNALRSQKGISVICVNELKKLMEHLAAGRVIGTIADHGGKAGVAVEFFGKLAMTPVGSMRLAKKMNTVVILAFMRRIRGARHEMILRSYELVSGADAQEDIKTNFSNINKVFEGWIRLYPEEYLWFYKRWKYSPQKNVLILSDGKTGHLNQSLACAELVRKAGFKVDERIVEVVYKSGFWRALFEILSLVFGARISVLFLPFFVQPETYKNLSYGANDLVISAGSSVAAVNQAVSYENNARSVSIMKPGVLPVSRFDLVIAHKHDGFVTGANVVSITGSLNTISPGSIEADFRRLLSLCPELVEIERTKSLKIGLLLGGDSKNYKFTAEAAGSVCRQLKKILDEKQGILLLTTSRRTPEAVTDVFRSFFSKDPACRLFVVASEYNPCGTVGGILFASDVVIVSGESISMVSEAAACGKQVLVFEPECSKVHNKVERFLNGMSGAGHICLVGSGGIYDMLLRIFSGEIKHSRLDSGSQLSDKLKRILDR